MTKLQLILRSEKYNPTEFPESMVEPDQSLTIQEIMLNVARTGQTGLPNYSPAVYDDNDQNDDNGDFDDPTLDIGFDKLDALRLLSDTQSRYKHSVRDVVARNERYLSLRSASSVSPPPDSSESSE